MSFKSSPVPPSFPLAPAAVVRLRVVDLNVFDSLPDLGIVLVQARNPGGGLGKYAELSSPLLGGSPASASVPEIGLVLSLEDLCAIHATSADHGRQLLPSLDFDFRGQAAGLSLMEMPGVSRHGGIDAIVRAIGGTALDFAELERWRAELAPPLPLCARCRKAALKRSRNPAAHPLHAILIHAEQAGSTLHGRLLGGPLDLTASFRVDTLTILSGFLIAADHGSGVAMHLNIGMVHGFSIENCQREGEVQSVLSIWDMHGRKNFELASGDPDLAMEWRKICDVPGSNYRRRTHE